MPSIYEDLGFLILGTRLRRMSEYFLSEVGKVYQELQINFEPSWFPLFYILYRDKQVSIKQLADELNTSHSAMSQLVTKLKDKGLIETLTSKKDRRIQLIALTQEGEILLQSVLPIWNSISTGMKQMESTYSAVAHFLPALGDLEKHFESQSLSEVILHQVEKADNYK